MSQILKQGNHGFITKLQSCQNTVKVSGKALVILPQFLSFIAHIVLDFMPALEKHGLNLDLEGIINIHIPGLC